jgi:hypothetical protein
MRPVALFLLVLAACTEIADPALDAGAEKFSPPPVYQLWWDMTRACSGRTGALSSVQWYVVPRAHLIFLDGQAADGYWSAGSNRIVLAGAAQMDGAIVRHEMLHALIQHPGHARGEYLERCGGVVSCWEGCVKEAGPAPAPPADVPRVLPSALDISVEVNPSTPSGGQWDGYFSLTVRAHNPSTHPIVIILQPPGASAPDMSFAYRINLPHGSALADSDLVNDLAIAYFAANETKQRVFDFFVSNRAPLNVLSPGSYVFQAGYGGNWSIPQQLTVSP